MKYDIHSMKINLKGHARKRFDERFPDMSYKSMIHHFKTGKLVKRPKKTGDIGRIVKRIGRASIGFKFVVQNQEIWIITIE